VLDRDRLAKVLALTTSPNDAEALAAIRKANDIVKGADLDWSEVLATQHAVNIQIGLKQPGPGPFGMSQADYEGSDADWSPPHLTDKVIIETMFRAIYSQPRSDNEEFWQWLDSVHQHWLDHRRLTPKQYQGVRRSYARALRSAQA